MKSNIELLKETESISHRIITLDLTIRTLEVDVTRLSVLKIHRPLITWYEQQISVIHAELKALKKELGKMGAKIDLKSVDKDGNMQVFDFYLKGTLHKRPYFNVVLKNIVENEIANRLGVSNTKKEE